MEPLWEFRSSAAPQNLEIKSAAAGSTGPPWVPHRDNHQDSTAERGREALRPLHFKVLSQVAPELIKKGKLLLVAEP